MTAKYARPSASHPSAKPSNENNENFGGFAAGQEDVRLAAVAVLKNTVHECLSGDVGSEHEGIFASLEAALGPTQQEIWISVLSGEAIGP